MEGLRVRALYGFRHRAAGFWDARPFGFVGIFSTSWWGSKVFWGFGGESSRAELFRVEGFDPPGTSIEPWILPTRTMLNYHPKPCSNYQGP